MGNPAFPSPPPTRILSWEQMVIEADPGWRTESLRPVVYRFSNGRQFVDPLPLYGAFSSGMTDDFGTPMTDEFGNQMMSDTATGTATSTSTATGFAFGVGSFGNTPF